MLNYRFISLFWLSTIHKSHDLSQRCCSGDKRCLSEMFHICFCLFKTPEKPSLYWLTSSVIILRMNVCIANHDADDRQICFMVMSLRCGRSLIGSPTSQVYMLKYARARYYTPRCNPMCSSVVSRFGIKCLLNECNVIKQMSKSLNC